jgi:hypothetical protein
LGAAVQINSHAGELRFAHELKLKELWRGEGGRLQESIALFLIARNY